MDKKKVNTVLYNFLRGFAPPIFNFLIALLGYRIYGAEDWGTFVSLLLLLYLFNFAANFGSREFLLRQFSETPQKIAAHFSTNWITRLPLLSFSLLLLLFYDLNIAVLGMAVIFIRYLHTNYEALIIYEQRFKLHFFTEALSFIIIVCVLLFNSDFSLEVILWGYLFAALVRLILLYFIFNIQLKRAYFKFDKALLIQLIPFFLIAFSGWLHSRIDLYIVDYFLTPRILSAYQILVSAFLLLDAVSGLIIQPFTKHIYRLQAASLNKMRRLLRLFCLPIVAIGSFVIFYFLENYTDVHFSQTVYFWMAIGSIPPFFYMIDIYILFRNKQEKTIMKVSFVGAAINILIAFTLIPTFNILGAAIAVCISKWVMMVIPYLVKKGGYLTTN